MGERKKEKKKSDKEKAGRETHFATLYIEKKEVRGDTEMEMKAQIVSGLNERKFSSVKVV